MALSIIKDNSPEDAAKEIVLFIEDLEDESAFSDEEAEEYGVSKTSSAKFTGGFRRDNN